MRMFGCCMGPARVDRPLQYETADSMQEKVHRLTMVGYTSTTDRIRQASQLIIEAADDEATTISNFKSEATEELVRALLLRGDDHSGSLESLNQSSTSTTILEGRLYALALILALIRSDDNKRAVFETSWLMSALSLLVQKEPTASDLRLFAVSVLRDLALLPELQASLMRVPWLLDTIDEVLEEEPAGAEIRSSILALCKNLACLEENKLTLVRRSKFMEIVSGMILNVECPSERLEALTFLNELSEARENKSYIMHEGQFMFSIQTVIDTEPVGSKTKACAFGVLQNLASARENKSDMFQTAWIIAATRRVMREEAVGSEVKSKAFGMLWHLALARRNQADMFKLSWLQDAVDKALSKEHPGSTVKANAFGMLWGLAGSEDNKLAMFRNIRLLEQTEKALREERPRSEVRANGMGMLCEIAVAEETKNALLMMKPLIDCVRRVLDEEPRGVGSEIKASAFGLLWNLALCPQNQDVMFDMEWLLVCTERVMRDESTESEAKANALAMLWNLAVHDANKPRLFLKRWVVECAVDALKRFRPGKNDEACANAFGLLQNLAGTKSAQVALFRSTSLLSSVEKIVQLLLPRLNTSGSALTKTSSGRFTPSMLNSSASPSEVLVNCMGMLQNLAFAPENKFPMGRLDWLIVACRQIIQEAPVGSELKANAFGVLWNLSGDEQNQLEMLSSDGHFKWLLPSTERVLKEELIGSGVKTFALGMLKELSTAQDKAILRRSSWLGEIAERIIRDEPVGSQTKVNTFGLLSGLSNESKHHVKSMDVKTSDAKLNTEKDKSSSLENPAVEKSDVETLEVGKSGAKVPAERNERSEPTPPVQVRNDAIPQISAFVRMDELLRLTEQVIKEETNSSPVKAVAFEWIASLAGTNEQSAMDLLERHPSLVSNALRSLQDKLPRSLERTLGLLLFHLAKHESSRAKLASLHSTATTRIIHRRLCNRRKTASPELQRFASSPSLIKTQPETMDEGQRRQMERDSTLVLSVTLGMILCSSTTADADIDSLPSPVLTILTEAMQREDEDEDQQVTVRDVLKAVLGLLSASSVVTSRGATSSSDSGKNSTDPQDANVRAYLPPAKMESVIASAKRKGDAASIRLVAQIVQRLSEDDGSSKEQWQRIQDMLRWSEEEAMMSGGASDDSSSTLNSNKQQAEMNPALRNKQLLEAEAGPSSLQIQQ